MIYWNETLNDPEQILHAFDSHDVSEQARRELALFAETVKFDERQRSRLVPHLWDYVIEHRTTRDAEELVALGSAIRKLVAYFPARRFDELCELLEVKEPATVPAEIELEVVKGLAYRLSWDSESINARCPRLCDAIFDVAALHSSKRDVEQSVSSAIAVNVVIVLALLGDDRVVQFTQTLPSRSFPWFVSVLRSRARRLLLRMQADKRTHESMGLLPKIVQELSAIEGK